MTYQISKWAIGFAAIGLLGLGSCKKDDAKDLAGKKAQLAELKANYQKLDGEIQALEMEILEMEPSKETGLKTKPVTVTPVTTTTFKHFIQVQGNIEAEDLVPVNARMAGTVTKVFVQEGDAVKKGQVLAQLDIEVYKTQIKELETALELVNTLYEKQKRLWDQKIGTEIQYISAKNQKESLEARMKTLKATMEMNQIISPISGVVDAVLIKEGQAAAPGFGLFNVVNLSRLKVIAKIADSYISRVKVGDFVQLKFPDLKETMDAKITFVSKTVDPLTRTFSIEVALNNGAEKFRPNMIGLVYVNDETLSNAVVIEENILQTTEQGIIAYVAEDVNGKKTCKARVVKPGLTYNGQVHIEDGLKPNDALITSGYADLVDGQPVEVIKK